MTADVETDRPRSRADRPAPSGAVPSRVRNRPRPAIIALGIALIIVAGLAAAFIYTSTGRTVTVFSASADIARGDAVEASALTTVEIPDDQRIPSYLTAQADSVIGSTATVDIPAGTIISPNNTGTSASIPAGTSLVGISLTPAQLPPYPLVNGDPVRIVETPVNGGEPPATTPETFSATIATVEFDDVSGNTLIAVSVDALDAADVAARAATGRVGIILDASDD